MNSATFQSSTVLCTEKKWLRMCFWMQVFGKLWSVPPSFPRGSLLTDQHKSSPSDSSAGHSSAGFSWRGLLSPVICISRGLEDRLWNLQDCHFSSLLSWYSSSNKHFFSLSLFATYQQYSYFRTCSAQRNEENSVHMQICAQRQETRRFLMNAQCQEIFPNVEENHYMFYYIFHKMRTVAVSSGIGWSSDPSNINLQPAAQSIKPHHTHTQTLFFPSSVWTKATWVCVCGKVNFITFVTALLFPPLSGWMIQWLQLLYTVQREARAIISQLIYSSAGQRMRFKLLTMHSCVVLECVRSDLFRPPHCKNTCLHPQRRDDKDEKDKRAKEGSDSRRLPSSHFSMSLQNGFDLGQMTSSHRQLHCLTGDERVSCAQLLAARCYHRPPHSPSKLTFETNYFLLLF